MALVLERRPQDAGSTASVTVEQMAPEEVTARFGMPAPSAGDRAVVLTFRGPITLVSDFVARPALDVIEEVRVEEGPDGLLRAIVGVTGDGCHRLSAPFWAFPTPVQELDIILDVRASP